MRILQSIRTRITLSVILLYGFAISLILIGSVSHQKEYLRKMLVSMARRWHLPWQSIHRPGCSART